LLAAGYFEAVHFSDEDKKRADDYQANAKRIELKNIVIDLESYLKTLNMKAKIKPFNDNSIKRVTQLISKSNQFNLTGHRYEEAKIRYFMNSDNYFTIQARLEDSFGDNGLVSAVICKKVKDKWIIKVWVMSCRVLGRRLEESVFYEIVSAANNEGIKSIIGEYIPSERNKIVSEHFLKLGFKKIMTAEIDNKNLWQITLKGLKTPILPIEII
jgi:FkbH-like protein